MRVVKETRGKSLVISNSSLQRTTCETGSLLRCREQPDADIIAIAGGGITDGRQRAWLCVLLMVARCPPIILQSLPGAVVLYVGGRITDGP